MHSNEWLYAQYAGKRSLYECHGADSCHKGITYDDWHCHECQNQGKSEMDQKLMDIDKQIQHHKELRVDMFFVMGSK